MDYLNAHEYQATLSKSTTPSGHPTISTSSESAAEFCPPDDPACIVGIGCRLPGGIHSPSDLWKLLSQNRTTQGRVPPDRFNIDGFYHPDGSRAGIMDADGGYFLQEDVRKFDNNFFGINNLEATYMDPQQRKLLEVTYECLESAGVTLDAISGTNTGVYVGNFTVDYQTMQTRDPDYLHRYSATGSGTAIMSNRLSHTFNLQGPSFTLDTACSSSIYCLHAALSALRVGDCDAAIVAGANLITSSEQHLGTMKGGVLSPTSTCHTFDASADGYGRGEAVNVIYVKRLSAAIRDGDNIRAVIRGTAINSNGRTPGITLPSSALQEAVIRKAYANAGLQFADTDYVECHGTGTAVGDPIEVEGIGRCFGGRSGDPLMIGAVKTNVGHSEAASGLTAVIKAILAFENAKIPPTYGVKNLNPKLKMADFNLKVVTSLEDWPRYLRRASINSFGYGGANAHAILESIDSYLSHSRLLSPLRTLLSADAEQTSASSVLTKDSDDERQDDQTDKGAIEQSVFMLPVSAKSAWSLGESICQIKAELGSPQLTGKPAHDHLRDVAFTLGRRSNLPNKGFLLATCGPKDNSIQVADGPANDESNTVRDNNGPILAFVFTGQGAQYAGMSKELLVQQGIFRSTIQQLDAVLQGLGSESAPSWTLEQSILDPDATSQVHDVARSQPLCTAIQIALLRTIRDWGLKPAHAVGHSSGEIAAAYAANILTAEQAILVAYFRGLAVKTRATQEGCMMAAGISANDGARLISDLDLEAQVCVACVNSPNSVTLSGSQFGIEKLGHRLQEQGKFARKLVTGGRAYHSHMMAEIGPAYETMLLPVLEGRNQGTLAGEYYHRDWQGIQRPTKNAKMYSSVGHNDRDLLVLEPEAGSKASPRYWRENLESPVQFSAALSNLLASYNKNDMARLHVVEVGPHGALKGPIEQIRKSSGQSFRYGSILSRGEDANECLMKFAGSLFLQGHDLNWAHVNSVETRGSSTWHAQAHLHDLPPYPWDYSNGATGSLLWSEPRASVELRNRKYVRHELLGTQQLATNGIDWSWRNMLRLSEISWLSDHKLESQIVFPAAGYLAMAVEAMCQSQDVDVSNRPVFEFRNVNISSALVIADESSTAEIHTTLSRRKLSTAMHSTSWCEFGISSWTAGGQATLHCAGSVRISSTDSMAATVNITDAQQFDTWSMGPWYSQLAQEGLRFGPEFQSLTSLSTDSNRSRPEAISTTRLLPSNIRGCPGAPDRYAVHPLMLDACLQGAIMGGTAGDLLTLRAHLPVFIAACQVRAPAPTTLNTQSEAVIHTNSKTTSFATKLINATLRSSNDDLVVTMGQVRLSLYQAGTQQLGQSGLPEDVTLQRHPCLVVSWKPDIHRLIPPGLERHTGSDAALAILKYTTGFAKCLRPDLRDHASLAHIWALIDLAGFKQPAMRVFEVGDGLCRRWLDEMNTMTVYPRCQSWSTGNFDDRGKITDAKGMKGPFDLVVVPGITASADICKNSPDQLLQLLDDHGTLIIRKSPEAITALQQKGMAFVDVGHGVLLSLRIPRALETVGRHVYIVVSKMPLSKSLDKLVHALSSFLSETYGITHVATIPLDGVQEPSSSDSIYISLLEMEETFLASMTVREMDLLRRFTETTTDLVWVTGANMLGANPDPNLTLSSGLSRALMLEQPSLRFAVLDVGPAKDMSEHLIRQTCVNVMQVLKTHFDMDDKEFVQQRDGLLYISRFLPDRPANLLFRQRLDSREPMPSLALAETGPARLAIRIPGQTDTIHFQRLSESTSLDLPVPPGHVDIQVKAVSLNAKDIYTLAGRVETRTGTSAIEFSGVVVAVGSDVEHLRPGDHAVVLAPNHFGTIERVVAWAAHKMLENEDFTVIPTLPVAYGTALYALQDRAGLRTGESILVHSGAGAFGMATCALAQRMGAEVFATVGSQAKKDFLVRELGLSPSHIFHSRDASFAKGVLEATGGRGVDVIINSLVGDLMHDSWDCLANFGRFVEVGKRELVDAGKLDMRVFLRNCTFTAFDLTELFFHEDQFYRDIWINKTKEVLRLYRAGEIKPVPITVFDVANIAEAYRHFSTKDRVGKVVVSLQDPTSRIPISPSKHLATFSPKKVYLLVGCLGGLGRSLSRWMVSRGARCFVFLGRSGCDKPEASQLVERLRRIGRVEVVRGDVVDPAAVESAYKACDDTGFPIGGVVQAAMGLSEALFGRMTNKAWHTGIQPKFAGTWNLHKSLEGRDGSLDFFLLTSSVSGSVGTATESNYCSANGFLDAFARWRRCQGKPAVSVGLGMISNVGYLHENPEIEALLLRKGIQPLNETEFLQVIDLALAASHHSAKDGEEGSLYSHMLTGLEPFGIRNLMAQGFDVNNGTMQDPRSGFLAAALTAAQSAESSKDAVSSGANGNLANVEWAKLIPTAITGIFASEADATSLHEAVLRLVRRRFSSLILIPVDQVDVRKPLLQFGVDSMLSAEFRTWFWSTFRVDVPFLDLMSPEKGLDVHAAFVVERFGGMVAGSGQ